MNHEKPDFDITELPIFIGPDSLARLFDIDIFLARRMIQDGTVKAYDVGTTGLMYKRTTLKEVLDYFEHVT